MAEVNWRPGGRVLVTACGRTGEMKIDPPVKGTVRRMLTRDDSAWVELDERQRDEVHDFSATEARGRYVLTWEEFCEPVPARKRRIR